jgi:hypothetical protein
MSMLLPPQMLNTMMPNGSPGQPGFTGAFYADPVRRYMVPAFSDRRTDWPSHPYAQRDSHWTKDYQTAIEADDELALSREYPYYDPIYLLPESGQAWWRAFARSRPHAGAAEVVRLAGSGGSARQDAV